jgi:hypothetical protein
MSPALLEEQIGRRLRRSVRADEPLSEELLERD